MASASEISEEDEENAIINGDKVFNACEGIKRSASDSKIKKLRRKISQSLRLSFLKDERGSIDFPPEQGLQVEHNDVFDNDSTSSPVFNKVTGKQSVRRTVSDSIGARLRKVSFEIGNGRRHSDEFTTEQLPQSLSPSFGCLDSYQKLEQLGEGSYATVYKGICSANNKIVALKEIRLQEEEGAPFTAIREASLLKELKHANIVTLHDIIHTKDTLMFVFEFVDTDLNVYLEKHPRGIAPNNVKLFLFQLLRGLAYIHDRKILHRYRPPDVLLGSKDYTTSLDMWGVGCIFVEMVTGIALFPGMRDTIDQLNKIWQIVGTATEETWPGVTRLPEYNTDLFVDYPPQRLGVVAPKLLSIPGAESLATELVQSIPKNRISATDALRHLYFTDLPKEIFTLSDGQMAPWRRLILYIVDTVQVLWKQLI
ncbi:Cyclin-dependent kinase 14 [Acropora cervicornis]|uniref:cyclin-dependent kinase n=1 Tax=Acropora cervicornis TaxID=6130 RepID=A0AAD9V419_ACRCE|nr:Cyclin-dependent kinase 14 [Acropora cervicornis]